MIENVFDLLTNLFTAEKDEVISRMNEDKGKSRRCNNIDFLKT
jgi:hypothetical protein